MKYIATLSFLLTAIVAQSQISLAEARLSLTDKQSEIILGKAANELPEMLINAFKQGKLKAYRFGFQKEPVYGKLKQWPNPKDWNDSFSYDENDSVLYKGKLYRYIFKRNEPGVIQLGGLTPDIAPDAYGTNDYWIEYKRVPPVIGMKYSLPTENDLLKAENWESVKSKALRPRDAWDPKKEYYMGDQVEYQDKIYEAIRSNVKSNPTNKEDWQLRYYGVSDDAFTELQFAYNSDSRLPIAFQLSLGRDGQICIGFYMEAVQKYLKEAKQEVAASKLEGLLREMER